MTQNSSQVTVEQGSLRFSKRGLFGPEEGSLHVGCKDPILCRYCVSELALTMTKKQIIVRQVVTMSYRKCVT